MQNHKHGPNIACRENNRFKRKNKREKQRKPIQIIPPHLHKIILTFSVILIIILLYWELAVSCIPLLVCSNVFFFIIRKNFFLNWCFVTPNKRPK